MENKPVFLLSPIIVEDKISKSEFQKFKTMAKTVDFPSAKQRDLLYFKAVFVSSGTNKNAVTFLPSELLKAKDTIAQKAIDLEHEEHSVVGHIYEYSFVTPEGIEIPIDEYLSGDKAKQVDQEPMDVVVAGVIYKARFPELADEINNKEWFVSMEAYFEDFDIKVGELILPRSSAKALGLTETKIGKTVKAKFSKADREYHNCLVSRVLRNILFSGAGIVKEPANPNSIVLETASTGVPGKTEQDAIMELDLSDLSCESARETSMEKAGIIVEKYEQRVKFVVAKVENEGSKISFVDSTYDFAEANKLAIALSSKESDAGVKYAVINFYVTLASVPVDTSVNDILKDSDVKAIYDVDKDGSVISQKSITSVGKEIELGATYINYTDFPYTWPTPPAVEVGPRLRTITEGICVSFKKNVFEYDGSANPGKIIHEHWCNLFNEPCPVLGALAKDKKCLRNSRNQLTKDAEDTTLVGDKPTLPWNEGASAVKGKIDLLKASVSKAQELLSKCGKEAAEKWDTKFINSLPNSSFAACESGVDSKNGRHLPHHGKGGGGTANVNLDLPHLRNALARANQVKPVGKMSADELKKKCMNHLNKHRSALKSGSEKSTVDEETKKILAEIEYLYEIRNKEIFGDNNDK